MPIIEGAYGPSVLSSAPVAPGNAVQTMAFSGAAVSTGTFTLVYGGMETAAIPGSATPATIVASIDGALEALPSIGTGGVTTAATTYAAGAGNITVTFAGPITAGRPVDLLVVGNNSLTGTPTITITSTTTGVRATIPGPPVGATTINAANGDFLKNTGTPTVPVWTAIT